MSRISLLLLVLISLTSCKPSPDPDILAAEEAVKSKLKDPESAQFRNVVKYTSSHYESGHNTAVCGEVNSKNGFGGYVGFTEFMVIPPGLALLQESYESIFADMKASYCKNEFLKAN